MANGKQAPTPYKVLTGAHKGYYSCKIISQKTLEHVCDNVGEREAFLIAHTCNFYQDLLVVMRELLFGIEAYDLSEEIDAGCDGGGPFNAAIELMNKIDRDTINNPLIRCVGN